MTQRIDDLHVHSDSERATELLGLLLGEVLADRCVIALEGTLGMGKTAFSRGLVEGILPGEGEFVASPTYAVCNVYPTEPTVYHYDLYRLQSEDDLESVGFYDTVEQGVLILEWPDQVPSVRRYVDLDLRFQAISETTRRISLRGRSDLGQALLTKWRAKIDEEKDTELYFLPKD